MTRVSGGLVTSRAIAGALVAIPALPLTAAAQEKSPGQSPSPLEQRRARETSGRPIVHPEPRRDQMAAETERAAAEYERARRDDTLLREPSRPAARRPDLGYDVTSGIQQRNIQRAPLR